MSKVVPSKFMSANVRMGADSFKEITTELTRLLPVGVNSSTAYSPSSLNKIVWKLPCYSQCFLDNSRSFISFNAKLTGQTVNSGNTGVFGNGLPIFERVVVKTSDGGLVIEDITDLNVLQRLFTITSAEEDYGVHRGVYGTDDAPVAVGNLMIPTASGVVYTFQMNHGILGKDLSSYLPVFMMGTTYCIDLELYLAPATSALKEYGSPSSDMSYTINNPVYNLCLLRMDSGLCAKFNEIACNPSERISLPFTTFRNHVSTLTSQNNTVHIHESGTNLKRIWSVFTNAVQNKTGTVLPFVGSVNTTESTHQITKYNYKLGTKFLYNEPVEESINNNITLKHVKNAVWSS